jgi:iron complex transport system permease protein
MGRFLVLPERLVLGGVVLNAFFISATLFLYALANPFELLEAIAYTLGYVPYLSLAKSLIILGFVIGSFSILVPRSKNLDALSLGDDMAHSLGIQPVRERILQLAFSSVPVALCVSYCGPIGFLGIVFPHLVRFTVSGANRFVLKFSFLWGGFFLVLSDFFARKILSPSELPVGTITALGLSPIFLWVLRRVSWERRWF